MQNDMQNVGILFILYVPDYGLVTPHAATAWNGKHAQRSEWIGRLALAWRQPAQRRDVSAYDLQMT